MAEPRNAPSYAMLGSLATISAVGLEHEMDYIRSSMAKSKQKAETSDLLKGWAAIAKFLGLSSATAHRWAKAGMPARREGRFTVADRAELEAWLGRESGMPKPAHVMTR